MKKRVLRCHNDVLVEFAESIDISKGLHKTARQRYLAIGNWLKRPDSKIRRFAPAISPQGSFLLGTVVRPANDGAEFDIDLVCTLKANKKTFSMADLKRAVGVELEQFVRDRGRKKMPEDKRRCWAMQYPDKYRFHMDILPSIRDADAFYKSLGKSGSAGLTRNQSIQAHAIAITDNTHEKYDVKCSDWPVSNPLGYGIWFHARQSEPVQLRKQAIMKSRPAYARVDDVPDYLVKTPLQRVVQLLKRHRDVMFNGGKDEPISIIISTLAALAYSGERTTAEALRSILVRMLSNVKNRGGVPWVPNPVYRNENFADKWEGKPRKREMFNSWLRKAQIDFFAYLDNGNYRQRPMRLQRALSRKTAEEVLSGISV